jgi:hypothetical protein
MGEVPLYVPASRVLTTLEPLGIYRLKRVTSVATSGVTSVLEPSRLVLYVLLASRGLVVNLMKVAVFVRLMKVVVSVN